MREFQEFFFFFQKEDLLVKMMLLVVENIQDLYSERQPLLSQVFMDLCSQLGILYFFILSSA